MQWFWRRKFRRTTVLLAFYIAVLCGIGLARSGQGLQPVWCWAVLPFMLCNLWKRTARTLLLVIVFGLCCGWWRGSLYMQKLSAYQPLYYQKITITAQAMSDGVYGTNSQISFDANKVQLPNGQKLAGRTSLSGFGLNAVFQGDEVQVSGKLYPSLGAYQGRMSFAQIQLINHHSSAIAELRRKFAAGMQSALPEPLASFAMGLLIGQRATLPASVKQDLLMVGLTHIIAVSGYNLTIMLHASRKLLARRSKRMGIILSFSFIGLFLLLAGASASIVRAAIVSMLSILAAYYGRSFKPLNLITLAAAITAWASPFYLWSDTSWYLSFLAFYGVMILAPLLVARLRPGWQNSLLIMVAVESVCAETMTLPFVLHTFGQMSFIGLPANVMVVTLVPLAMLLSLLAGLGGMLAGSVAGWIAWPARVLLNYMLDVAHVLAGIPHVFVQNLGLSIAQMIGLYGLILVITQLLSHKTKPQESAKITDRDQINMWSTSLERTQ